METENLNKSLCEEMYAEEVDVTEVPEMTKKNMYRRSLFRFTAMARTLKNIGKFSYYVLANFS